MNILITGTSRGVGQELAKQFAANNHHVYAVSRSAQNTVNNITNLELEYSTEEGLAQLLHYFKSNGITIDVLINNAATLINKDFASITKNDFNTIFDVNVAAPYFLTQQLVSNNLFANTAAVYNISSMGGFQGTSKFAGLSLYSMTKGTITNMTEVLAEELKDKNITVNAFALGAVATQMLKDAFPTYEATTTTEQMANFIVHFITGNKGIVNGKIIPVSNSTP
jgi:3-oxoacyl-[acyl-carrier protein] reductase